MEQFRASEEDWQRVKAEAIIHPIPSTICELRDRVAALEAEREATCKPALQVADDLTPEPKPEPVHSQYFSGHGYIVGEINRALAEGGWTPNPEPEPSDFQTLHGIALDMVDSLRPIVIPEILETLRRAIREPMADPTPEPDQAPAAGDGGLVDAIADIIGNEPIIGRPCPAASAVILAVAKWLRSVGNHGSAADLDREASR